MAELDLLFLNKTYYESQLREVKMKKTLCSNFLSPTNYFCSALYSESLFSLVSSFYFSGCLWILTLLRWLRIKSRCCSNSESNSYHTVCIDNGDDYCSEDCSSGSSFINSYSINPTNLYRITLKIEYFFYTVTRDIHIECSKQFR